MPGVPQGYALPVNRILFKEDEIGPGGEVRLSDFRAGHVLEVLGAVPGKRIRAGVINGACGHALVEETGRKHVVLKYTPDGEVPPFPDVDLLLALPRPKVMKRLWAPLASMGVGHIVVTNAAKVERNYFDTKWLEKEDYEPLMIEGLMQSGDTRMPKVTVCRRFKVFVEDQLDGVFPETSRFVFHPGGSAAVEALNRRKKDRVLIAIGPEGGWTDYELDLLAARGFECISMGWRILRSDTACVAALALVNSCARGKS